MSNIFYAPEKFGLEVVAEIEYTDGCYQFDTRVVWRYVATGTLYTARDGGCSCPTPFEDFTKLEDLDLVDRDFAIMVKDEARGRSCAQGEVDALLRAVAILSP